jgi:outer membrane protein OmpA-like peptidoglycan-associated protein
VSYTLTLNGIGNVRISNIGAAVLLPDGVEYVPGTMRVDGEDRGDPRIINGAVSFALPEHSGNWTSNIEFRAEFDATTSGEMATRAVATFDTPMAERQKTPLAETRMHREPAKAQNAGYVLDLKFDILSADLSAADKAHLDQLIADWRGVRNIRISAVGHSDSTPIRPSKQHLFTDNYVLSRARANAAVSYIAGALSVPHDNLQVEGRGPDDPVADNSSAEGRSRNRRVELIMSGVRPSRPSFLEVTKPTSGAQVTQTVGAVPGMEAERSATVEPDMSGTPASQQEPPIDTLQPGIAMLLPEKTFAPAIAATKISIQHRPGHDVEVWLNGAPVSSLNFDTLAMNAARTVAISRWKGVDLQDGQNEIRAVIRNAEGRELRTITRRIYYSGPPIRAEFLREESTLVADGKTRPVIAVRLFDRAGEPSRTGTVGTFRIDSPYRAQWEIDSERRNVLVQIGDREPTYRVSAGGIAYLELAPTTRTGEVTARLQFENFREQEVRAWLRPAPRDWILVGFAEGTGGYNTLSDNAVAAADAGFEEGYYDEGRAAFFAKGQIKGEFLLTLAYDSDRERSETRDRFQTAIDPNEFYPLYADTSEQRFEAPSQRKLYVKLERGQFNALFGDTDTGLSVTDLARYERRFNGFKSEFRGENVGYTVFAAETAEAFNRDDIRGDGTSGPYRLSNTAVIGNSDKVWIETRDRFDSSRVLSSQQLARFLDYSLDPVNGTLYFKRPVPSRDLEFNPVFIVVEYETRTDSAEDLVVGGRGSVRSSDDSVEVGVTHVNDDTVGAEAELTGADFRWQISDETEFKAEYAETKTTDAGQASASTVSLEHNSERTDVRAYIREVEDAFGLGYQNTADKGFRRLGVDARIQASDSFYLEGEAAWQQNLVTEDIRNLLRARVRYQRETFTGSVGVTHAEDKFGDGDNRTSDIAELTLTKRVFDDRLNLRISGSTELGSEAANLDFPTSIIVGADYRISKGVELITEYEDSRGADIDAQMTRVGVRASPWARSQVDTSVTNQATEFGPRLFANVGLVQGFQLNKHWSFDIGVDQVETILEPDARPIDPERELVSGSLNEDFVAVYTGAMYTADLWSANARLEYRDADSERRSAVLFGWYREPSIGHGLSAALLAYRSEGPDGTEMTAADMRFGWAYRMADGKWSFLNRVDLVYEDTLLTSEHQRTWRVINNLNANRRFSARTQMSLQYAFKYVRSEFDSIAYTGYTDLIGFDIRRGMRGKFDLGVNTSIYHSWESNVVDYGFGVDVGYNFASNLWITLGYNVAGFYDEDFNDARYTAEGPFLRFSLKADQHALKRIAGRE